MRNVVKTRANAPRQCVQHFVSNRTRISRVSTLLRCPLQPCRLETARRNADDIVGRLYTLLGAAWAAFCFCQGNHVVLGCGMRTAFVMGG